MAAADNQCAGLYTNTQHIEMLLHRTKKEENLKNDTKKINTFQTTTKHGHRNGDRGKREQ